MPNAPSTEPAAPFSPATVTPQAPPPAIPNPTPPAQVPVVESQPPAPAPPTGRTPGKARANPIHRPVFKGVGKMWHAPKKTVNRLLSLRNPSHVMRAPRPTVGAVVSGMAGYTVTGMTGGALDTITNFVAGKAGVGANPLVEPVRDFVRISGEGYLGGVVYPQLTYRIVHGIGGAVSTKSAKQAKNAGRGVWLGSVLLTGVDLFSTLLKYGDRAVKTLQGQAVPAAETAGVSALSALGLGSLAVLLKGPAAVGAGAAAGVAGTAEVPAAPEVAPTAEVAGLDGSDVGEVAALQRELRQEMDRNRELKSLAGVGGEAGGVGSLLR